VIRRHERHRIACRLSAGEHEQRIQDRGRGAPVLRLRRNRARAKVGEQRCIETLVVAIDHHQSPVRGRNQSRPPPRLGEQRIGTHQRAELLGAVVAGEAARQGAQAHAVSTGEDDDPVPAHDLISARTASALLPSLSPPVAASVRMRWPRLRISASRGLSNSRPCGMMFSSWRSSSQLGDRETRSPHSHLANQRKPPFGTALPALETGYHAHALSLRPIYRKNATWGAEGRLPRTSKPGHCV